LYKRSSTDVLGGTKFRLMAVSPDDPTICEAKVPLFAGLITELAPVQVGQDYR